MDKKKKVSSRDPRLQPQAEKKIFRLRTLSTTYVMDETSNEMVLMRKPSTMLGSPGDGDAAHGPLALVSSVSKLQLSTVDSTTGIAKGRSSKFGLEGSLDLIQEKSIMSEDSTMIATSESKGMLAMSEIDEEAAHMGALINHMKRLIILVNLTPEMWHQEHVDKMMEYLKTSTQVVLMVYFDVNGDLCVSFDPPTDPVNELYYFIKNPGTDLLTMETFSRCVHCGNMKANLIISLLRHMHQVFIPIIMRNNSWPDSIKNDFVGQLYKFMAGLTDIRYKLKGQTVFYIPPNIEQRSPHPASRDRDFVQRLEGVMVQWIRQMKELSSTESIEIGDNYGPLTEIDFWKCRCDDLMGVVNQLNKANLKHFLVIMQLAKSSYLPSFEKLSVQIANSSAEARSNHQFLLLLQERCQTLSQSSPDTIPSQLPHLVNTIRFIWVNSMYYNTREKITGLFRKVSNEIIQQCCRAISEEKILDGYSIESIKIIQECMHCCSEWRRIYEQLVSVHNKFSTTGWHLDSTSIFAQIDAFSQRCSDLLMLCNCQIHFGQREYGETIPIPAAFSGRKKHVVIQNMVEVEELFRHSIEIIAEVKSHMLAVRSVKWHDAFSKFYTTIKDLDIMVQNNINLAFEYVRNISEGLAIVDTFSHFNHRDTIRRVLNKKITDIYTMLSEEINAVRKDFIQKRWASHPAFPYYAGHAFYALSLRQYIARPMTALNEAWWFPIIGSAVETVTEHEHLEVNLNEYLSKMFQEWLATIDDDPIKRLEIPLMCRSFDKPGMIDRNFDKTVLKHWQEILFWKRLHYQMPHKANELFEFREPLRACFENVSQVSRDYNKVISVLSPDELLLFKERILYLDRKIHIGLTKLKWSDPIAADIYSYECRPIAAKVQNLVHSYKISQTKIGMVCENVSELRFVYIDTRKAYDDQEFKDEQSNHREIIKAKIQEYHDSIVQIAMTVYEIFKNDGAEVRKQWLKHVDRMDTIFEEGIRLAVRKSLKDFLKTIAGEDKVPPVHLFKVKVILSEGTIDFQPSMDQLAQIIHNSMKTFCQTLTDIERLATVINQVGSKRESLEKEIIKDEESLLIQSTLNNAMTNMILKLQAYLHVWEPYKDIWEVNKDLFLQRYHKMQPTVATFDADIARYTEVANNVQTQDSLMNLQFCVLDCLPLKIAILEHCAEWQSKFTDLLKEMTISKLHSIYDYIYSNTKRLLTFPVNLDELKAKVDLHNSVLRDKDETHSEFASLKEQFVILAKYEVSVSEQNLALLQDLENQWQNFLMCLDDVEEMIKKFKDKFKNELLDNADDMKKLVTGLVDDFFKKGPFTSGISPPIALDHIREMYQHLLVLKKQEEDIRKGLTFFKIDQPPSKELQSLEKDFGDLKTIWELNSEWNKMWEINKFIPFPDLVVRVLEDEASDIHKRVKRVCREVQDRNWEIATHTLTQVDQFKKTLPVVLDLKNPAMRERHWDQIKTATNQMFDETSADFNLQGMISMGMEVHGDAIHEISAASVKELAIEEQLKVIAKTWEEVSLDMAQYRDKIGQYYLRTAEDVMQALEENQMILTAMKSSRFVKPFEPIVDNWERSLSAVLETVEGLITVQRLWMYLENIFVADDIRKQLPSETFRFDVVNIKFKEIGVLFMKDNNALRASKIPNVVEMLNAMGIEMDDIQKSLDMYLETKRRVFPRFYFISNDDILEILGQSKNPEAIQIHLKKCFDNLNKLKIVKAAYRMEAHGMYSAEGEYVEFHQAAILEGPVEGWLCDIEYVMHVTLREVLNQARLALRKQLSKRDKWMKDWPGQLCITANQMQWTADCTRALSNAREVGEKGPIKTLKKKQVSMLSKFTESIRGNLPKLQRVKVVALVTIEVHARDVIEKLIRVNCMDVNSFEWLSQLRFYWENNECMTRQTNTKFPYMYEYLGNTGRLVITPLTDRCYITLTTALHLHRGGSPLGPAGTGKTETTKDLGKALAVYVIVINCSEGLDYISMGKMFAGLAQSGCWICYDEFNRISIEVLSVVAQQVICILSAMSAGQNHVVFQGDDINLLPSGGIFITMNPGYAGRTELPDNLKSMFRPIAMITPDLALISEISLFGEGFENTRVLAKKVTTLYALSTQQLSKQDHYDFGLRGLVAVLRHAGKKRRQLPHLPNEEGLLLAMTDMNTPKMTASDNPLFNGIINDLFPGVEISQFDYSRFVRAIESELVESNLQSTPITIIKIIQLYETKNSRHSTVAVGQTQTGKSVVWHILQKVLTRLNREGEPGFNIVREFPLNPKAIEMGELYGEFNLSTNEWQDGVLSSIARNTCNDERPDEKWIVFDGPIDTLWIESMNSLMDDNKVLTLINGDRIAMPEQVSLLFETQDLSVASPATVSRCGMVFLDYRNLGWRPYVESWLNTCKKPVAEELRKLFDHYLQKLLDFKTQNCTDLVPVSELGAVKSLCRFLDMTMSESNKVNPGEDGFSVLARLIFIFSCIWTICASVDESSRFKIDSYIREAEATIPNKDTVYEYFVDTKLKTWILWEDRLAKDWRYNPNVPFFKIMVPTVDTFRYKYLVTIFIKMGVPVLLVGPIGTGKTSLALSATASLVEKYKTLVINLSAQTSSKNVQDIIESKVEKRTKGTFVPIGGKMMITFMDDLNMPAKDLFGSQPPLELIAMWCDYGFWYDRAKQVPTYVKDMVLLAAMGPPGGGRSVISQRLQSRFALINMTFPQDAQIKRIYGTMIIQKLTDFDDDVKVLAESISQATIEIYNQVALRMLPTPAKIHYLFNLRDISKVFQGLLRANIDAHNSPHALLRLWTHESFRVFSDRLADDKDRETFLSIISEKLATTFNVPFNSLCSNKQPPVFLDAMNESLVYQDIRDLNALKTFVEMQLEELNKKPGQVKLSLVAFKDALDHLCRIIRVIRQPQGNMLLIGIGGSGRQTLSKLSTFICKYMPFQIEVKKGYKRSDFRDDLKSLYNTTGVYFKSSAFIFADNQVVDEGFMEDISNILSSGEVPNLFRSDEMDSIRDDLIPKARREGIMKEDTETIINYFIDKVRGYLHVILCMSPVGEPFRNRIRMYPAFVNSTMIDWFSEWPIDALLEVAAKFLESVELQNGPELRQNIAHVFAYMHKSVGEYSIKLRNEMKRYNYVTPTNYLDLVIGYIKLLAKKRKEVGDSANKLRNGLFKLDDSRIKVKIMSVELADAHLKVAEFQKQCDDYLVVIVQQKRDADEQAKSVTARSEKIGEEEIRCKKLAEIALQDLAAVMPALEEALVALESLNKKDLTEIKSYGRPPPLVERVMEAVMILRGAEPTWAESKRQLGESTFITQLKQFDKDNISDKVLKKIGTYCSDPEFQPDIIGKVSGAAKSLCMWVRAMEVYGRVFRVVLPKKLRLMATEAELAEKQRILAEAKANLEALQETVEDLRRQYDEKLVMKEELRMKAEELVLKLERAEKLVEGLSGEKIRWEETVKILDEKFTLIPGDCLIAAGCVSYFGPFLTNYREALYKTWLKVVHTREIPYDSEFNLSDFLTKPTTVREWNSYGLPNDDFSTENGIIVKEGNRWALMIDPQGQAQKWIKNMEMKNNLKVIDLQQPDLMTSIEMAIQNGYPTLLQNIKEELHTTLNPILDRAVYWQGDKLLIKLGDREVEYNERFLFYITTKLSNPHYTPETASKVLLVNFAVKEQGLESQLLGIVVRKERPELEMMKDNLVKNIASGKAKMVALEDLILQLLSETSGSLLDDETLIDTLQSSKKTSQEVKEQLEVAEETEISIDSAREQYSPCATRASILFFLLNEMSLIDPMYEFSLDSYIELFTLSIEKSPRSHLLDGRISNINDYHTYAVYRYTCRGLFEQHKLLFSFHMCAKILESAAKLNLEEYSFFLRGGTVLDRGGQVENPCQSWLNETAWDNITELEKMTNFRGIVPSFEQFPREWYLWYISAEPENTLLPGDWQSICNELQRIIIIRCLRPDRVSVCAATYIVNNLGPRFVEPPILDMNAVLEDSNCHTPLVFVLSTGVDPTGALMQLAESKNMLHRFQFLSLGQGQAPAATRMIDFGTHNGMWVFLANCHLSLSWMPELEKLVEQIQIEDSDPEFRLWLSSSPNPQFPISILQAGIKMTTEPPKGLKPNMQRLYGLISDVTFSACKKPEKYKKLLFTLVFFHSLLLERRKFQQLGWNVMYGFNDSDFEVSENLLTLYLDEYEDTAWDAMKYLIAGVMYGGHVTDDWDRRLMMTYIGQFFCDEALDTQSYKLSSLPTYYIPRDGPLHSYRDFIKTFPNIDNPEAFGQHPNADIAAQIIETSRLFDTLLSMQVQVAATVGGSKEDTVMQLAADILQKMPSLIDYDTTEKVLASDPSPFNVVLLQEIQRYNVLLNDIRSSLIAVQKGIQGLVVMSADLEEIFNSLYDGRVPGAWLKAYLSMKPLGAWTRDLILRVDQFATWAITTRRPILFWLAAFTFPTGFLTAVLQAVARQNNIPIDTLTWEFYVSTTEEAEIVTPLTEGIYVRGLFLEGAGWDKKRLCLKEASPMQLVSNIPVIHFRPVEGKKKSTKGLYVCPTYYYPKRSGTPNRASFVVAVDLKSGLFPAEHWVKRATAMLMSLAY